MRGEINPETFKSWNYDILRIFLKVETMKFPILHETINERVIRRGGSPLNKETMRVFMDRLVTDGYMTLDSQYGGYAKYSKTDKFSQLIKDTRASVQRFGWDINF